MNAIKTNYLESIRYNEAKNMVARPIKSKGRVVFCLFLLICLAMSLLQSCVYHNEEELYPNENCGLTGITFSDDILPIINANCAVSGCHVQGTGIVSYTSFEGFKSVAESGALRHMVVETKQMPPTGPLSDCNIDKIEVWINQGALNN